jgi:hypothetical protein
MQNNNKKIKKFYATAAACILGKTTDATIYGSPDRVSATEGVIDASKVLYEALANRDTSFSDIKDLLIIKEKAARNFEAVVGISWLL